MRDANCRHGVLGTNGTRRRPSLSGTSTQITVQVLRTATAAPVRVGVHRLVSALMGHRRMKAVSISAAPCCFWDPARRSSRRTALLTLAAAVDEALSKTIASSISTTRLTRPTWASGSRGTPFSRRWCRTSSGRSARRTWQARRIALDVTQQLRHRDQVQIGMGTATSQIPGIVGAPDIRFYNADTSADDHAAAASRLRQGRVAVR